VRRRGSEGGEESEEDSGEASGEESGEEGSGSDPEGNGESAPDAARWSYMRTSSRLPKFRTQHPRDQRNWRMQRNGGISGTGGCWRKWRIQRERGIQRDWGFRGTEEF